MAGAMTAAAAGGESPLFRTVTDLVREHAARDPQLIALVQDGRRLTYGELDGLMERVAAALQRDGCAPGDVAAICAGTSIESVAVFLGALHAGVVVAPLPPGATPEQLAAMAADSGARHLFVDAANADAIPRGGSVDGPRRLALDSSSAGEPLAGWLAPDGVRAQPVAVGPDAAFNIIYSSGTTGTPKGIVQPHRMRFLQVRRYAGFGLGPGSVTLVSTPLYSNTTLVLFVPAIASGGTVVLMAKFDAGTFLQLAQRHRVTHAMLVPIQYRRLLDHPAFDATDLTAFRFKFCTSAPFLADLKAEVLRRWPGGLVETYGLTEGGGACMLEAHAHADKLHTVGRPVEGHEFRLIDERGIEVAAGEAGEIVGRSAGTMLGYHRQPEATAAVEWRDASGQRYLRSGDIGRFDADGFLVLLDRRRDLVISGGFNVYPSDLEAVLRRHPDVADAAVVGVPSHEWGETPVAFVVAASGATIAPETLRQWVNAQLGKTQRLSGLRLVEALPRSAIGKVLKRELRDRWRQGEGESAAVPERESPGCR
jgi:acyl-CoA synthetase (AMP-forming)/AMP-acid ligase II